MLNMRIIILFTISFVLMTVSCSENTENKILKQNANNDTIIKTEGNWKGCMVSAYIFQEDGRHVPQNFEEKINNFEKLINHKIGSVMWYPTFADNFPTAQCEKLKKLGLIPHLTWELFIPDSTDYNTMPIKGNYKMMNAVLEGKYDAYIKKFAQDAKQFQSKVLIRFLHEFNGNWYLWSGNKNGREKGGPQKVVAVWKYVVDIFKSEGANNVKWIWCPHGPSVDVSPENWNDIVNYWPGNDYVDWIGMDAYNWYPQDPWGGKRPFRDFDNCFQNLYDACTKLGNQPVMIAEFATPEFNFNGNTKADWIKDALFKIKNDYPRVKMFVWFNINKEMDWRINSSPEAHMAFKKALRDTFFIGKIDLKTYPPVSKGFIIE